MLALTFKPGQRVEIETKHGERITIHINRITANSVKLAFECDRSTEIVRGTQIDEQKEA